MMKRTTIRLSRESVVHETSGERFWRWLEKSQSTHVEMEIDLELEEVIPGVPFFLVPDDGPETMRGMRLELGSVAATFVLDFIAEKRGLFKR